MNRFERVRATPNLQKYLSACLLATAALLGSTAPAWAQTPLGAAAGFSVLGGTNVTCTASVVTGDVGVSPGSAVPFTSTGCTIAGATPPATNRVAAQARNDFLSAYTALGLQSPTCTTISGTLAGGNLAPGVYCVDTLAKTGLLTLTGPANGVWVFLVDGALTGTDFSVVMEGGGQPCNVSWVTRGAATLTNSAFKGNILAGDSAIGSITLTGGTLAGRALANVAVTMTNTSVIGCAALSPPALCPDRNGDQDDNDDGDDKDDEERKDKERKGDSKGKKYKGRDKD